MQISRSPLNAGFARVLDVDHFTERSVSSKISIAAFRYDRGIVKEGIKRSTLP